jgi:AcrR family transcriptional regulator
MARPLSPEKRNALLVSAAQAVAEQGVLATTASIARRAGVAEGTLFTYFESKEALFQELYLHLKRSLADTIMPDFPAQSDYKQRLEHLFQRYVSWGVANPEGRSALSRLVASGQVLEATRTQGMEFFEGVAQMMDDAVREKVLAKAPVEFLYSIIEHIADTTIEYVEKHPKDAQRHRQLGFRAAWRATTAE